MVEGARATVHLVEPGLRVETDAQGRYQFAQAPWGRYTLRVVGSLLYRVLCKVFQAVVQGTDLLRLLHDAGQLVH